MGDASKEALSTKPAGDECSSWQLLHLKYTDMVLLHAYSLLNDSCTVVGTVEPSKPRVMYPADILAPRCCDRSRRGGPSLVRANREAEDQERQQREQHDEQDVETIVLSMPWSAESESPDAVVHRHSLR